MLVAALALYWASVALHALAWAIGLAVLAAHGPYFRTRRTLLSEARYLTIAASTVGNVFLGGALAYYAASGLTDYLPPKLELLFAVGHAATAFTPVVWHALTYAEIGREASCGNA